MSNYLLFTSYFEKTDFWCFCKGHNSLKNQLFNLKFGKHVYIDLLNNFCYLGYSELLIVQMIVSLDRISWQPSWIFGGHFEKKFRAQYQDFITTWWATTVPNLVLLTPKPQFHNQGYILYEKNAFKVRFSLYKSNKIL